MDRFKRRKVAELRKALKPFVKQINKMIDEEEAGMENMPENFQTSSAYLSMEEARDELEEAKEALETAIECLGEV